jgi:DNA-binding LacI/PurR family transcriptional regulator/DNA-binding transcriptional regulator YhcF (GntR family)
MKINGMSPNRPRKDPAPDRALAWMRSQIETGIWQPGDMLPTLEELAADAGVSRHTMWKAVHRLVLEKLLFAKRGCGIVLAGKEAFGTRPKESWQNIAQALSGAIYSGEFVPGMILPPLSKLQIRFNACYWTMHKALALLVSQRIITRDSTRYIVPHLHTPGSIMALVLFSEGGLDNERMQAMIPLSEQHAQKMGLHLVRYGHSYSLPLNRIEVQRISSRSMVAGFVVDCWGLASAERTHNFISLLTLLYSTGKPIAIIDEVGMLELPEPLRSSNHVRILTIASRTAGEEIGRYLLTTGHRHCVFLTTMHHEAWSQKRYAGLRHAFVSSGIPECKAILCEAGPLPEAIPIVCAVARLTRREMELLFLASQGREWLDNLLESMRKASEKLNLRKEETELMRRHIKPAIDLFKAGADQTLANTVRNQVFYTLGPRIHQRFLQPVFRQVLLTNQSATAWVAANDGIGKLALTFLREQKIKVPGSISVIGFDNSLEAMLENLTSIDYDIPGMLHQAMSFAAGRPGAASKSPKIIEWPGILYQRQSSGKAP